MWIDDSQGGSGNSNGSTRRSVVQSEPDKELVNALFHANGSVRAASPGASRGKGTSIGFLGYPHIHISLSLSSPWTDRHSVYLRYLRIDQSQEQLGSNFDNFSKTKAIHYQPRFFPLF